MHKLTHAHHTTLHTHIQKCLALPPQDLDSHTLVSPQVARRCSGGASRIGDQNFPLSHWTIGRCCCATALSLSLFFPRSQRVVSAALIVAQSASLAAISFHTKRPGALNFSLAAQHSRSLICRGGEQICAMCKRTVVRMRFPAIVEGTPLATMLRTLHLIFSITGAQICTISAPGPTNTPSKTVAGWIGDVAQVQVHALLELWREGTPERETDALAGFQS